MDILGGHWGVPRSLKTLNWAARGMLPDGRVSVGDTAAAADRHDRISGDPRAGKHSEVFEADRWS